MFTMSVLHKALVGAVAFVTMASSLVAAPAVEVFNTSPIDGVNGCVEVRAVVGNATSPVYAWSVNGDPAPVFFDDAAAASTEVFFAAPGDYTLCCTVTDGSESATAETTVHVVSVGMKPVPDLAHYALNSGSTSKAQYGTGSVGSHYLYFPGYLDAGVKFADVYNKAGYFEGSLALSSPTPDFNFSSQGVTLKGVGGTNSLTFAAWINGDGLDSALSTFCLIGLPTTGFFLKLWRGDGAGYPIDPNGKCYIQVVRVNSGLGEWIWRTPTPVCPASGWTHIALALDGQTLAEVPAVFLDGAQQTLTHVAGTGSVVPWSAWANGSIAYCNKNTSNGGEGFCGRMSDLRLYGWQLGENDLQTLMLSDGEKQFAPKAVTAASATLDFLPGTSVTMPVSVVTCPAGLAYTAQWSALGENADQVTVEDSSNSGTHFSFAAPGTYSLKLVLSNGIHTSESVYAVTASYAALVQAGADQAVTRATTWLEGVTAWHGIGDGSGYAVTGTWTQVSGPALAGIANPDRVLSEVTLPAAGEYVFRLTGVTSLGTFSNDVVVTRLAAAPGNLPPTLTTGSFASNDVAAARGYVRGTVSLTATVNDPDSFPSAIPRLRWFRMSGPGGVFFDDATAADTVAGFSAVGDYVIGCEASDGDLAVTNTLALTVEVLGDKPDPDGFLYLFSQVGGVNVNIWDTRYRTRLFGGADTIWEDGRFPGTYGFRCPTATACYKLLDANFGAVNGCSFACWIETHEMTNGVSRLFNSLNSMWFGMANSNGTAAPVAENGNYYMQCGYGDAMSENGWTSKNAVLPTNGWNHVAVFFNRTNGYSILPTVWLNGERVELNDTGLTGSISWSLQYAFLGNRYSTVAAGSKQFPGIMSDIRFFMHEIGDKDVQRLMKEKYLLNRAPECYRVGALPSDMVSRTWYDLPYEAHDDGLPQAGALAAAWSVTGGNPGLVVFDDPTDPASRVRFQSVGEYELTLTLSDGQYERREVVKVSLPVRGLSIFVK